MYDSNDRRAGLVAFADTKTVAVGKVIVSVMVTQLLSHALNYTVDY